MSVTDAERAVDPSDLAAESGDTVLELRHVSVSYLVGGQLRPAVEDVSLAVPDGGFVSLVGPSGCGKSTLLHAAAGLMSPTAGTASYLGNQISGVNPDVGYVTQKDTVLPWRTVLDNIALPLQISGMRKVARREAAAEMAASLGLGDSLRSFPTQLSGGMRQRVQLGRTLIRRPRLLLMDEPFGALDAYLRLRMQELLLSILSEHRPAVLFVTHDLSEAISLSDEVVALTGRPGRVGMTCTIDALSDRSDLMAMRAHPAFGGYERELWRTIAAAGPLG
jgi:sulfonate transport system ATP-binding protein